MPARGRTSIQWRSALNNVPRWAYGMSGGFLPCDAYGTRRRTAPHGTCGHAAIKSRNVASLGASLCANTVGPKQSTAHGAKGGGRNKRRSRSYVASNALTMAQAAAKRVTPRRGPRVAVASRCAKSAKTRGRCHGSSRGAAKKTSGSDGAGGRRKTWSAPSRTDRRIASFPERSTGANLAGMRASRSAVQSFRAPGTDVRMGSFLTQYPNPTLASPHVLEANVGSRQRSSVNQA